jgi:hypothetical protein
MLQAPVECGHDPTKKTGVLMYNPDNEKESYVLCEGERLSLVQFEKYSGRENCRNPKNTVIITDVTPKLTLGKWMKTIGNLLAVILRARARFACSRSFCSAYY